MLSYMHRLIGCLGLILGINMLYLVIYVPISPITLVLACSGFLILDLHISSQVMGEKDEVEAKWIEEGCKRGPLSPRQKIQGKIHRPKRSTKTQRLGNGGIAGQRPPRPMVGVARPCVPRCHRCFGFFCALSFSCVIFSFFTI